MRLVLGIMPFGIEFKPLDLYGLFGEIDVDSRGLLLPTLLLVPFVHGVLRLGHHRLQGLAQPND
jgi:hypothetical protein